MPSKKQRLSKSFPPHSPPAAPQNPNPNPNPNPKKHKKPKPSSPDPAPAPATSPSKKPKPSAMIAATPAAPDTTDPDTASPRKSHHRKRKSTDTPDEEPSPAVPPSTSGKPNSLPFQRRWTDDDVLTLLKAVANFRSETGAAPTGSTMPAFFDSVKSALPKQFTQDQVYNKLRHLRQKYQHSAASGLNHTPLFKLFVEAWGEEAKKPNGSIRKEANADRDKKGDGDKKDEEDKELDEEGEEDAFRKSCPRLIKEISAYWKDRDLPEELLTMAMKLVDPTKAKALEGKWQRHHSNELKLQAKRFDLSKETYMALAAAQGTGS